MMQTRPDLRPFVDEVIAPGIKAMVLEEADKVMEEAIAKIRKRLPEIVSACGIRVMDYISAERFGQDIRITISMPKEVKP